MNNIPEFNYAERRHVQQVEEDAKRLAAQIPTAPTRKQLRPRLGRHEANVTFEIGYTLRLAGIPFELEYFVKYVGRIDLAVFAADKKAVICFVEVKYSRPKDWHAHPTRQDLKYMRVDVPYIKCFGYQMVQETVAAITGFYQSWRPAEPDPEEVAQREALSRPIVPIRIDGPQPKFEGRSVDSLDADEHLGMRVKRVVSLFGGK